MQISEADWGDDKAAGELAEDGIGSERLWMLAAESELTL